MKKEYVMGNSAIALGALAAGVNLVSGYPGTPSSEIVEVFIYIFLNQHFFKFALFNLYFFIDML